MLLPVQTTPTHHPCNTQLPPVDQATVSPIQSPEKDEPPTPSLLSMSSSDHPPPPPADPLVASFKKAASSAAAVHSPTPVSSLQRGTAAVSSPVCLPVMEDGGVGIPSPPQSTPISINTDPIATLFSLCSINKKVVSSHRCFDLQPAPPLPSSD